MSFLNRDKSLLNKTALIVDVGSASIGAALVNLRKGKGPKILYTTRKEGAFIRRNDPERLLKALEKSLGEVVLDVQKNGLKMLSGNKIRKNVIDNVYCFYASPWFVSHTSTIEYENKDEKTVTKSLIDSLVKHEEDDFENSSLAEHIRDFDEELLILERKVIQIKINGYETSNPIGKTADHISLSMFMSLVPKELIEHTEQAISAVFSADNFYHHSFTLCSYSVINNLFPKLDDYLFLDINGATTDVVLVNERRIKESGSFPFGSNMLLKQFAKFLNTSPEEGLSTIALYNKNMLTPASFKKTDEALFKLQESWGAEFSMTIESFSDQYFVPHNLFFMADDVIASVFKQFLERGKYKKYVVSNNEFNIRFVDTPLLKDYYTQSKTAKEDSFLTLETLFSSSIFSHSL